MGTVKSVEWPVMVHVIFEFMWTSEKKHQSFLKFHQSLAASLWTMTLDYSLDSDPRPLDRTI